MTEINFLDLPELVLILVLKWLLRVAPDTLVLDTPHTCKKLRYFCQRVCGETSLVSGVAVENLEISWHLKLYFPNLKAPELGNYFQGGVNMFGNKMTKFGHIPDGLQKVIARRCGLRTLESLKIPRVQRRLSSVTKLDLAFNPINRDLDLIGKLTSLVSLSLTGCRLESVPASIGNLVSLEVLILERNILEEVPESIGNLVNLKILNLKSNRFETVPDSIRSLIKLQRLEMSSNSFLWTVPDWVRSLPSLVRLDLSHTPVFSEDFSH